MYTLRQLCVILLVLNVLATPQKCGQHMVENQVYSHLQSNSTSRNGDRRLSTDRETGWSSIRIKVEFLSIDISADLRDYIENQVIEASISWYSKVLNVRRLTTKLMVPETAMTSCVPSISDSWAIPNSYQTTGVDADYIFFVGVISDSSSDYVGFASPCVLDPVTNQPVIGYFVLNVVEEWEMSYEDYLSTTIHEMFHALGFSPGLFSYFLNSNGELYGATELMFDDVERDVDVTKIRSPNVLLHARSAFNCDTLDGVELESSGGTGTVGSHWDKRIMNDDFMVADASVNDIVYSDISLALLEDSGWYGINYPYTTPIEWGYKSGCSFLTTKCLIDGEAKFSQFCDVKEYERCDYKHLSKGYCNLGQWSSALPEAYQYFSDGKTGGQDKYLDYCPIVYQFEGGNCRGLEVVDSKLDSEYGEKVCENCRCIEGTYAKNFEPYEHAGCHWIECKTDYAIVHIGDVEVECPFSGGDVEVPGYNGVVHCPSSNILCDPKPCMNHCSGIGLCVKGVCQCPDGSLGGDCGDIKADFSYSLPADNTDSGTWTEGDGTGGTTTDSSEDDNSLYLSMIGLTVLAFLG